MTAPTTIATTGGDTTRSAPPSGWTARLGWLERWTQSALLVGLVALASWTLVYQVALFADLQVPVTATAALALTATLSFVVVRTFWKGSPTERMRPESRWQLVAAAVVAVLAIGAGLLGHQAIAISLFACGSAAWAALAIAARYRVRLVGPQHRSAEPVLWVTGWLWALACGALSALTAKPDGDDAYFVNLAQWVSDRGDFPRRDTMLSDEVLPAITGHDPPIHSIEGLFGAIGYLTGQSGAAITYVVAAPVLTVAAVLALTWLVSVCRIPFSAFALSAAVLYLLTSGGSGASFGNFFAPRMWQGKSVLATLVLPLVTAVAIEFLRRGGWRRGLALGLAVVAAVGASNTAVFLLPVLLGGVVLAALLLGQWRRAAAVVAVLAYPLVCGVIMALLATPGADPTVAGETGAAADPSAFLNPITAVPGAKGLMVATYLAVCLGWLGMRSLAARAVVVSTTLATSLILLPPVTHFLTQAGGVGPVLWRMWWVVPVPLLVGALTGVAAGLVHGRARALVAASTALVVGLMPLVGGRWIGPNENGARWSAPTAWKVPVGAEASARMALRVSRPGDVLLAPWDTTRVVADMSVDVHPVSARSFYLHEYESLPGSLVADRRDLQSFADGRTEADHEKLRQQLDRLSVDTACVRASRAPAVAALEAVGFHAVAAAGTLVCFRRSV
ncbi:hypothetical protein FHX52_1551 [Humibacillus xanthopallidus]|uniref:Dolichyl-phosphate-mannose-protein mannosyltransferase n=1 Tax=Humibacillus xanthopallidus TaxID=412689 RepID=A0A543PWG7_9MICO|nr:hypothetical protein FHX52_1551 [Humibacillus xanthopallidus]